MPVPLTYPGVYIEEISSGVRTIVGVSTSVTAFIGYTPKGPLNKATQVFNYGEFERIFGELKKDNELGYAVRQFFFNGGSEALVVRVAKGAGKASVVLRNGTNLNSINVLEVKAKSEGLWGNNLRLDVDYDTDNPDSTFNLTVTELKQRGMSDVLAVETYQNMSMDSNSPKYVVNVVKTSKLIEISRHSDAESKTGSLDEGWSLSGDLSKLNLSTDPKDLNNEKRFISVMVDGKGPYKVAIFAEGSNPPSSLADLRTAIETAVTNANPAKLTGFTVKLVDALRKEHLDSNRNTHLLLTSNTKGERSSVCVLNASTNNASQSLKLGITNGGREREAAADLRPAQTGTTSGDLSLLNLEKVDLSKNLKVTLTEGTITKEINLDKITSTGTKITLLSDLANLLNKNIEPLIKNDTEFPRLSFQVIGNRLRIISGAEGANVTLKPTDAGLVGDLKLGATDVVINVQKYDLGVGNDIGAQKKGVGGNDGISPDASDIQGSLLEKTGIYALEDADIFNLLCIPMPSNFETTEAISIINEAVAYCERKRAFMIIDPPRGNNKLSIKDWKEELPKSSYAALYYPQVNILDPNDGNRPNSFPPSGTVAGLYARTDSTRGVWKAPAGIDAALNNVQAMDYNLTDAENGDLNKRGINCLRSLVTYGRVSWGARTLKGADQLTSEWKYIPVRRLALYIEESLFRALKWVVFEPNDEPLWSQIRLNVGAFMHSLFRQGAFQGTTPREAYFVKCDKETTTQDDINKGIVNIVVGFAPLKPAEFVVIKLQQMAGEIQT